MSDDSDQPDHIIRTGLCQPGVYHGVCMRDGKEIDRVHLHEVTEGEALHDCDLYHLDAQTGRVLSHTRIGNGPAQVATDEYRSNYDEIFGSKDLN